MAEKLHPIVAELAAEMIRSPDHTTVSFPTAAVEKAQQRIRASNDDDVVAHLIALAAKIRRVARDGGMAAILTIGALVADKLGSTSAAADRLVKGGMQKEAAALLGRRVPLTAPRSGQGAPEGSVKAGTLTPKRRL